MISWKVGISKDRENQVQVMTPWLCLGFTFIILERELKISFRPQKLVQPINWVE